MSIEQIMMHNSRTLPVFAVALALLAASACDSITGNCQSRSIIVQEGTLPGGGTVNAAELASLRASGWTCTDDGPAVSSNGTVLGEQYSCRKC